MQLDPHCASDQPHYWSESNILYMAKSMWSDHHIHIWVFPKQLPQNSRMPLYALPLLELSDPSLFQHDSVPVHKVMCVPHEDMVWVEECECAAQSPDFNRTEHLRDEMECWVCTRPPHPTPVPELTNALMAEWAEIHRATLQNLEKNKSSQKSVL